MPQPLSTYESFARLIDHSLVRPELTDEQVVAGLELARRYGVASVSVRPCDIDLAVRGLQGSAVKPGSVAGFPHGSQNTATKLYETRDLLRRGAREIDMVIAISKLLSREFQYVQTELLQMSELCHKEGALLKVILENAYLTDELKIIACRCCERAEVDFVKTSTGFAPTGYTVEDIRLMRKHLPEEIGIKAASGLRTVDHVLEVYALGCTRIGSTKTASLLDEWKARLSAQAAATEAESGGSARAKPVTEI
jgi:deoxyribose-phosphate aldolase